MEEALLANPHLLLGQPEKFSDRGKFSDRVLGRQRKGLVAANEFHAARQWMWMRGRLDEKLVKGTARRRFAVRIRVS